MPSVWTIVAMGAGVYALRLAGLVAPLAVVPPFWARAMELLPVALLAALVASSRAGVASGEPARIVALLSAGAAVRLSGRLWSAIACGLGVYWLAGVLGWGG